MIKTLTLLLVTTLCYSQSQEKESYIAFSTAIDIKNAILGSKPTNNNPAVDLLFQFAMVGKNVEVNLGYENFNTIHFDKYTLGVGYHFPLYGYVFGKEIKTILIPSIEPTLIDRWGKEWQCTSSHLSIGGNLAFRWNLSDAIAAELLINALPRTDLSSRYPELHTTVPIIYSNYLKILYKF